MYGKEAWESKRPENARVEWKIQFTNPKWQVWRLVMQFLILRCFKAWACMVLVAKLWLYIEQEVRGLVLAQKYKITCLATFIFLKQV